MSSLFKSYPVIVENDTRGFPNFPTLFDNDHHWRRNLRDRRTTREGNLIATVQSQFSEAWAGYHTGGQATIQDVLESAHQIVDNLTQGTPDQLSKNSVCYRLTLLSLVAEDRITNAPNNVTSQMIERSKAAFEQSFKVFEKHLHHDNRKDPSLKDQWMTDNENYALAVANEADQLWQLLSNLPLTAPSSTLANSTYQEPGTIQGKTKNSLIQPDCQQRTTGTAPRDSPNLASVAELGKRSTTMEATGFGGRGGSSTSKTDRSDQTSKSEVPGRLTKLFGKGRKGRCEADE